jgi:CheY-like chemotaxis protein/HPt (histidine-containing phosphotransfer) domain-containing protein
VFLDQMMPGISGSALAERIRATPILAETKLIIVSSAGRTCFREKDLRLEAVLEKPVRYQDLLDTLKNIYNTTPQSEIASPTTPRKDKGSASKPAEAQALTNPLRILLAEDNKINQQYATYLLKSAGFQVTIAENGHQAVDALRAADFDVVLMDIQMPELDGIQATRQIRALPAPKNAITIIAITAHAMAGAREEYLAAGMDDYISKPFQAALVLSKLSRIAEKTVAANLAPAIATGESPLDLRKLDELRAILPPRIVSDFISLYLQNVESHLAQIDQCFATGDFPGIASQAHMVVSVAGNVGAMQTSALARDVELASRDAGQKELAAFIAALRVSGEQSAKALREWLDNCLAIADAKLSA